MSTTDAPKATAQGTLVKTPFAHLMQFVMARELSGTLAVWPDEQAPSSGAGQDRVLFEAGVPVAMRCVTPSPTLAEGLLRLFARRIAPYAFYEGQNLLGRSAGIVRDSLDPISVLSIGVRTHATATHIDPVLRQLGARPVQLRVGFDMQRLHLDATEQQLVAGLRRKSQTVSDAMHGYEPQTARRLVYLLTLVKGLEAADGASSQPSGPSRHTSANPYRPSRPAIGKQTSLMPPPRASSVAPGQPAKPESTDGLPPKPGTLTPDESTQWDEFVTLHARLDDLNHFELLGVAETATTADVTSAYFALVKRWHPERASGGLAPLAEDLRELFERITEAHETLSVDDKRKEYLKSVKEGGGTRRAERMMVNVVEAAMDMQKAEVLMRRKAYGEALKLVEGAIERSPDEAANYAVRGWLKLLTTEPDKTPYDQILRDIDRTLTDNKRNANAHYYKGVALKRRGDERNALRHFLFASELDSRNIEAQREVRLARIRRQSAHPGKKPKLWDKLFKG